MRITYIIITLLLLIEQVVVDAQGVYFYRHKRTNEVHYVGKTNNFGRRHGEHAKAGRYFAAAHYRMDKFYTKDKDTVERYYIKKYNPRANIVI